MALILLVSNLYFNTKFTACDLNAFPKKMKTPNQHSWKDITSSVKNKKTEGKKGTKKKLFTKNTV